MATGIPDEKGMSVLFLLVDALRHDYVQKDDTPFLASARERGLYARRVRPSYGFCEIAEFLTGTSPSRNGYFCQMGLADEREASLPLRIASRVLAGIEKGAGPRLHELCRSILRRIARRFDEREIYRIPASLLPRFQATEAANDYSAQKAFGVESVFDVLREAGLDFDAELFVQHGRIEGSDEARSEALIAKAGSSPRALTLAYLGELDAAGHAHGPCSPGLRAAARTCDARVERIVRAWEAEGADVVILGDHGMLPVEDVVDIGSRVRSALGMHGLQEGPDYELFLDSTLCRVWYRREEDELTLDLALSELCKEDEVSTHCEILDASLARERGVPSSDRRYGDSCIAAKEGVLFWPDYFNKSPVKGMHGYRTELFEQHGLCLGLGPSFERAVLESCELMDLAPTLTGLLGLRAPLESEGQDLRVQVPRARVQSR